MYGNKYDRMLGYIVQNIRIEGPSHQIMSDSEIVRTNMATRYTSEVKDYNGDGILCATSDMIVHASSCYAYL